MQMLIAYQRGADATRLTKHNPTNDCDGQTMLLSDIELCCNGGRPRQTKGCGVQVKMLVGNLPSKLLCYNWLLTLLCAPACDQRTTRCTEDA